MVNGWEKIDMVKEYKIGQMELYMMENGKIIKLTVKDYFDIPIKLNMKENGNKAKHVVLV